MCWVFVNIPGRYLGLRRWGGGEAIDGVEGGLYNSSVSSSCEDFCRS